ncbi:multiheme c-type cytochrome [Zhaonella formicivorans]|uniref:multiheme c-type cytochrome n=1 Tax=Zhaonella formicivorans TaxID=2528593 RepID=UPI001D10C5D1|nr:cytochrome c3 family protein [Zhaonella formicivorans]
MMNKRLLLFGVVLLLALFVIVGCGQKDAAQQEAGQAPAAESQPADSQPAENQSEQGTTGDAEMVFVSSGEVNGCNDCHKKVAEDKDYSLTAELKKIEGHPQLEAKGVADCTSCHQGDNGLNKVLHKAHYGQDSVFVSEYKGACVQCHKLSESGKLTVAGLEPQGTKFVTVEVAMVDKAPGGCNDCHKKVAEDKDYTLAAEIKNIKGHPEVLADNVQACLSCHKEGNLAFNTILHKAHLQGEVYKEYGNSCINCHDQQNDMKVKGL